MPRDTSVTSERYGRETMGPAIFLASPREMLFRLMFVLEPKVGRPPQSSALIFSMQNTAIPVDRPRYLCFNNFGLLRGTIILGNPVQRPYV